MQAKLEAKKVKRLRRNVRIIEDSDGNKAVMVERIIFKGKKAIKWKDVKKYLEKSTWLLGHDTQIGRPHLLNAGNTDRWDDRTPKKYLTKISYK